MLKLSLKNDAKMMGKGAKMEPRGEPTLRKIWKNAMQKMMLKFDEFLKPR